MATAIDRVIVRTFYIIIDGHSPSVSPALSDDLSGVDDDQLRLTYFGNNSSTHALITAQ